MGLLQREGIRNWLAAKSAKKRVLVKGLYGTLGRETLRF
jgi:hypothetical protein